MLDAEKAAEGVIKSVKEFVARAVDPLGARLSGLESRIEEVSKPDRFKSYLDDAAHKENGVFDERLGGIERRFEATDAAIADAIGPFGVRLTGLEAKVEEAANTERFRPFLETALDAVRKESCAVDEKWCEIEKRLESSGAAIADRIDPLERKLAGLDEQVRNVVTTIPADRSEEISKASAAVAKALEETCALGKRIDGLEPRIEEAAKSAIEAVAPISERVILLETRYEDVKRDAIDAGITKAINDFSGNEVKPLTGKIGLIEDRLEDIAKIAEAVNPLTGKLEDLSERFGDVAAANDALQEKILKAVDVQIKEAVKLLPPPKDGEPGKDGVSAYQMAVTNGFSGSEGEWLGSLKGCAGKDGDSIIGPQGDRGKDAEPVDPEAIRTEIAKAVAEIPKPEFPIALVTDMVRGEVAKAVALLPKPQDGKDGLAGKDAEPVDVEKIIADIVTRIPVPKDGEPGANAYQLALDEGFVGTKAQWVESLKGISGLAGRDGKDGRDAREPRDGKDGEPGRDAMLIEVLPRIDTSKSVPRGTFASHNGGLWHAVRNTDPGADLHLCGWQSIVEGFPEIEIDQGEDFRTFTLRAVSSSGRKMEKNFSLPVVLDRGVFKADAGYVAGDAVSHGGSIWIAQHETKDAPGFNDAWRLAVKKGRDAKEVALLSPKPPQQVRLK